MNCKAAVSFLSILMAGLGLAAMTGCQQQTKVTQVQPDYTRPLPPGSAALRLLDRSEWPDLTRALSAADGSLIEALDRSVAWFAKPSTTQHFPVENVTHEQGRASVFALRQIVAKGGAPVSIAAAIERDFDMYTSVGWDGNGGVLFTAYYSPIFDASRTPTAEYRYPLYQKPPDLMTDPNTGQVLGRRVGDQYQPYPTRAQIEAYPDRLGLQGRELVWLRDKLDRYIIHVNGSARLRMRDGSSMHVGYSATNGLEYTSIGKLLVNDGSIPRDRISLPAIQRHFQQHPDRLDFYTSQNDRYVFFQSFTHADWPAGSLGAKLTPMRSVATDKRIFPRGCPTLITTTLPDFNGGAARSFEQLMVDQDTGGAIRTAGRADLYLGVGDRAGWQAGRQAAEGRLYYLILKPDRVVGWLRELDPALATASP